MIIITSVVAAVLTIVFVLVQAGLSRPLGIDFNLQAIILYFVLLIFLKGVDTP